MPFLYNEPERLGEIFNAAYWSEYTTVTISNLKSLILKYLQKYGINIGDYQFDTDGIIVSDTILNQNNILCDTLVTNEIKTDIIICDRIQTSQDVFMYINNIPVFKSILSPTTLYTNLNLQSVFQQSTSLLLLPDVKIYIYVDGNIRLIENTTGDYYYTTFTLNTSESLEKIILFYKGLYK